MASNEEELAAGIFNAARRYFERTASRAPVSHVAENTVRARPRFLMAKMRPGYRGEENPAASAVEAIRRRTPIHYMDEVERKQYLITVGPDGRFYDAAGQRALDRGDRVQDIPGFDTGESTIPGASGRGRGIYVMDENGNIYGSAITHKLNLRHSSFLSGGDVACSGEFEVTNGRLMLINPSGGHYRVTVQHLRQMVDHLYRERGLIFGPENVNWHEGIIG